MKRFLFICNTVRGWYIYDSRSFGLSANARYQHWCYKRELRKGVYNLLNRLL